jgi:hypothetical protein
MTFWKHNMWWLRLLGIGYVVSVVIFWAGGGGSAIALLRGAALGLLMPLTIAVCVMPWRKRTPSKRDPMDIVEVPRLALLQVVHIPCRLCHKPLKDAEPVVWFEKKNGWKSELAHAECAVYIRWPDGRTTRGGVEVPTDGRGGILGEVPQGSLLLTETEWLAWVKSEAQ